MTRTFIGLDDLRASLNSTEQIQTSDLRARIAINAACQAVLDYCGDILLTLADEILIDGSGLDTLVLPAAPAWRVSTLKLDDIDVPVTDWRLATNGIIYRLVGRWPCGHARFRVVYDHGYRIEPTGNGSGSGSGSGSSETIYDAIPDSIRIAALSMATRLYTSSTFGTGAISSETIGDYSYNTRSEAAVASDELGPAEIRLLAPFQVRGGQPFYRP